MPVNQAFPYKWIEITPSDRRGPWARNTIIVGRQKPFTRSLLRHPVTPRRN